MSTHTPLALYILPPALRDVLHHPPVRSRIPRPAFRSQGEEGHRRSVSRISTPSRGDRAPSRQASSCGCRGQPRRYSRTVSVSPRLRPTVDLYQTGYRRLSSHTGDPEVEGRERGGDWDQAGVHACSNWPRRIEIYEKYGEDKGISWYWLIIQIARGVDLFNVELFIILTKTLR